MAKKIIKRKYVGYIEDRLVTPYCVYEYLPTRTKYVEFPFANIPSLLPPSAPANPTIPDYQQKRFYSDERPIKWEDFKKMAKGNFIKE